MTRARQGRQKDLFGRPVPPPRESALLAAVLELLAVHPRVACAWRNNVGAMSRTYRTTDGDLRRYFVRFGGGRGAPDILGFLRDGARLLAIEVKRQGEKATAEQMAFLELVASHGGAAGVAYTVDDAIAIVEREESR